MNKFHRTTTYGLPVANKPTVSKLVRDSLLWRNVRNIYPADGFGVNKVCTAPQRGDSALPASPRSEWRKFEAHSSTAFSSGSSRQLATVSALYYPPPALACHYNFLCTGFFFFQSLTFINTGRTLNNVSSDFKLTKFGPWWCWVKKPCPWPEF